MLDIMHSINLYQICLFTVLAYTALGWLTMFGIKLNYGRLQNSLMKIYVPPKLAWFIFQVPNLVWAAYFIFIEGHPLTFGYLLFIIHYFNRDILYPLSLKTNTKVPLEIVVSAFIFTSANGYLQGTGNTRNIWTYSTPRYIIGTVIFFIGMWINIKSDKILQKAKQESQKTAKEEASLSQEGKKVKKYKKIDQFLFKQIANPNYLGQIIQWIGYAIVCYQVEAFLFALSTINILTPAAIVRSRWNHKNIQNYPRQRLAIFPFIL